MGGRIFGILSPPHVATSLKAQTLPTKPCRTTSDLMDKVIWGLVVLVHPCKPWYHAYHVAIPSRLIKGL